jgi:ribosomal protein S18 acetylase RimI-like enzyme
VGLRVAVRAYDPARDADALRACVVEHQDFHRALEPSWPEGKAIVDDYVAYLERETAARDGRVFIAETDGAVAGFLCVVSATRGDSPDDPAMFAWVHDVFVRPGYRRRGIATALMSEAGAFVRERGARELRLGVLDRNADARALYRRLGFRDYVRVLAKEL